MIFRKVSILPRKGCWRCGFRWVRCGYILLLVSVLPLSSCHRVGPSLRQGDVFNVESGSSAVREGFESLGRDGAQPKRSRWRRDRFYPSRRSYRRERVAIWLAWKSVSRWADVMALRREQKIIICTRESATSEERAPDTVLLSE